MSRADLDSIRPAPWHRYGWTGSLVSVDGTDAIDFTREDVDDVVVSTSAGHGIVGIVKLNDGRYAGWETWEDVTGDGFSADAYGGDTDILFAASPAALLERMSIETREHVEPLLRPPA